MQRELFEIEEVGERKLLPSTVTGKKARATPAPVGSGPAGETCRTCRHYRRVQNGNGIFRKCGLMESSWTRGPGTDIKASFDACREWKPKE